MASQIVTHGKWNVRITNKDGRSYILSYFGFKTKKDAEKQAAIANRIQGQILKAEVIKN